MVGVRRGNARSDDSGYGSNPNQHLTIEEWVTQKDKFRVAAGGLPRIQSRSMRRCDDRADQFFEKHVSPLVRDVFHQHRISYSGMRFDYWFPRFKESEGRNTLIVYSRDTNPNSWSAAAKAIRSLFYTGEGQEIAGNVQVEIRNREYMYNDYSRVLPDNPDLIHELQQVSSKVSAAVHTLMRGSWTSIAYHERISRQAEDDTMGKPTVIVYCRPGASCDYQAAEDEILKVLDTASHRIHVEFLPGEISLLSEISKKAIILQPLSLSPMNGSSLGIAGDRIKAGTLGGWVFLNLPSQEKRIKCVLTCYQVVPFDGDTIADHTDTHGILLDDPRGHVTATYPASLDTEHTATQLKKSPMNPTKKVEM
ncbi:hypothetical protein FQN54_001339 [Arachnomyces sp. PD_36]|nr:hypothetical protein FQN54_001339 [Arachnomyces sp. PD_36]